MIRYYIDNIDESLFFTKNEIKDKYDRLTMNLYIQFGLDLTKPFQEKHSVTDFIWATEAMKKFFNLNKKFFKEIYKQKEFEWWLLQISPKDENSDEACKFQEAFFADKRKKINKLLKYNIQEESI